MKSFSRLPLHCALLLVFTVLTLPSHGIHAEESMDKMWGDKAVKLAQSDPSRFALLDTHYGMFIHWGLYSSLGGVWKGKTYYGIGEWIKNRLVANIPTDEYMEIAKSFNPVNFDAEAIARTAKEAGMKYIVITSKHHEGFAMYHSKHPFNIVDGSPFHRDPMKELAEACRKNGLGFGFYYSHNQDWTAPGGSGGPTKNPDGTPATFEQYFHTKCLPQVREICTQYGPLNFIWFDTPGSMPEEYIRELAAEVRKLQPNALMCSRIGQGLGDYSSQGDMDIPNRKIPKYWETCDTTNDSWSYSWYDQNWKTPKQILRGLISTIARGGTYLLNVGLNDKGEIPRHPADYLVNAGDWIKRYPQVIYSADPSPWTHAQPWGDVTSRDNALYLSVFEWPSDGHLYLPGLKTEIKSASILAQGKKLPVEWSKGAESTDLHLPPMPTDRPASVLEVNFAEAPKVDDTLAIFPNCVTTLWAEFAEVKNAVKNDSRWMEKFGEWKQIKQVCNWKPDGEAIWNVNVLREGDYEVDLNYRSTGRCVWRIMTDEGYKMQNQQNGSGVLHSYKFGILKFTKPGMHTVKVSLVEGDPLKTDLSFISFTPVE